MTQPWQPALPYDAILCRYNEIATKGRNRHTFEDRLIASLRRALVPALGRLAAQKSGGRIILTPEDGHTLGESELAALRAAAPTVAGLSSLSPGFLIGTGLPDFEQAVDAHFESVYQAYVAVTEPDARTYAFRVRRTDKRFPMTATELEIHFANRLLPTHPDLKLDLRHAGLCVELEIRRDLGFLCFERIEGAGGLPVGSAGRVLALLSGGFDSPVACYQMLRRGCGVDYITFHSSPYTPPAYLTKVAAIARRLNALQPYGCLVAVNLLPAQKAVRDLCRSRYRTVLYRRFMLRIATRVAGLLHDAALVTGDNIGQVASQTLSNMTVINAATDMLVLRPLLTFEKLETVSLARHIGTYDLSAEQVPDSCTIFAPPDPATSTILHYILQDEEKLDVPALTEQCLQQTTVINVNSLAETPFLEWLEHRRTARPSRPDTDENDDTGENGDDSGDGSCQPCD